MSNFYNSTENGTADCEAGFKRYKCEGELVEVGKYREFPDVTSDSLRRARERAEELLPERHKCYSDKLKFEKSTPAKGKREKLSSSSSSRAPNDKCCGDKNSGKGDAQYSFGKEPGEPHKVRTASAPGSGPTKKRMYDFTYEAADFERITNMYRKEWQYYNEMENSTTDCCKYFAEGWGCTSSCRTRAQNRGRTVKRQLDNLYGQGYNSYCDTGWGPLMKFLTGSGSVPKKRYRVIATIDEEMVEYTETVKWKTKWMVGWKCVKNDSRPCCCRVTPGITISSKEAWVHL